MCFNCHIYPTLKSLPGKINFILITQWVTFLIAELETVKNRNCSLHYIMLSTKVAPVFQWATCQKTLSLISPQLASLSPLQENKALEFVLNITTITEHSLLSNWVSSLSVLVGLSPQKWNTMCKDKNLCNSYFLIAFSFSWQVWHTNYVPLYPGRCEDPLSDIYHSAIPYNSDIHHLEYWVHLWDPAATKTDSLERLQQRIIVSELKRVSDKEK